MYKTEVSFKIRVTNAHFKNSYKDDLIMLAKQNKESRLIKLIDPRVNTS